MSDYEYNQAQYDLEEVKENLLEYLSDCYYSDDSDPKGAAKRTYKYLESIVDNILKKKSYNLRFGDGGSPLWHVSVLKYLSEWIEAENKVCRMLGKQLDSNLKD
jgi:hypothetical protein